jgi:WW domain-containing oxidoreductase
MLESIPFGARSTADKVLAGVDLSGKRILVTGCNSGLGFETMNALTANGAHVIGLARSLEEARSACAEVGPYSTPIACDLADLDSVAAAAAAIKNVPEPLDAIVANAGVAHLPTLQTRYGVEMQFLVNHLGHFALINELVGTLRDGTGRIVIVSSSASKTRAPAEGIMFDNLDGQRFYEPFMFYGQSKLANALYAKELSRRLASRGIAVNALHPGATRGTQLNKHLPLALRLVRSAAQWFMKSVPQGTATQALLAASPRVSGISGEYWENCRVAVGNPLMEDAELAKRLWDFSEEIILRHRASQAAALQEAA